MWNNNALRVKILTLLAAFSLFGFGQELNRPPRLLLTPQRLKRLQRDRQRQTVRWAGFENRIESTPDSPERGFELALYYAVTRDEKRGRDAIAWALQHPCEQRQIALVLDWCGNLISTDQRRMLTAARCVSPGSGPPYASESARDRLFMAVAAGKEDDPRADASFKQIILSSLENGGFLHPRDLYAAIEYLDAVRSTQRIDLRENAPAFFSALPAEFLLSMKPEQVEHPDWMAHVSALALVSLDPNLDTSQFLQGWAMENRQMLRDGPGVAYELLWANPYLPGIGYQNLDPWAYDAAGRLFARSDWSSGACWIGITKNGIEEENCPSGWREQQVTFGHMTLVPMAGPCIVVPRRKNNEATILWKLHPDQDVSHWEEKKRMRAKADSAGMWRLPANIDGKICADR